MGAAEAEEGFCTGAQSAAEGKKLKTRLKESEVRVMRLAKETEHYKAREAFLPLLPPHPPLLNPSNAQTLRPPIPLIPLPLQVVAEQQQGLTEQTRGQGEALRQELHDKVAALARLQEQVRVGKDDTRAACLATSPSFATLHLALVKAPRLLLLLPPRCPFPPCCLSLPVSIYHSLPTSSL